MLATSPCCCARPAGRAAAPQLLMRIVAATGARPPCTRLPAELGIISAKGRNGMAELLEITADEQDDRIPAAARFSLGVEKRIHAWHRSCEEGRRWRAWSRAWPSSAKLGARSARRSAFRGALLIRTLFAVVMMSPFASPARAADDSTVGTIVRAAASESSSHFLCKLDSSGFGTTVLVSGYE